MARRKRAVKREVLPDPKYKSLKVAKFINNLMERGKKSTAEQIFYGAIEIIDERTKGQGLETFEKALRNAQPMLEVKSRRVGGSTYQVPIEVRQDRGVALATRWLISFAKARTGMNMAEKLAAEFMSAAKGEGATIKKKDDTHRMAEANKAFAHFRW
ncbi:MAG TPA: 30S ribosomal protein S7 [Bacteroidetes bacterium]|nr:30S ribosomal protein S7 [Bacteroidota bacterium]